MNAASQTIRVFLAAACAAATAASAQAVKPPFSEINLNRLHAAELTCHPVQQKQQQRKRHNGHTAAVPAAPKTPLPFNPSVPVTFEDLDHSSPCLPHEATTPGVDIAFEQNERFVVVRLSSDQLFSINTSVMHPVAARAMEQLKIILTKWFPTELVQILAHTDGKYPHERNMVVSREQAAAIKAWLQASGVAPSRVTAFSMGETRPIAANKWDDGKDNPDGRYKNRRIEIIIVKMPSSKKIPTPVSGYNPPTS